MTDLTLTEERRPTNRGKGRVVDPKLARFNMPTKGKPYVTRGFVMKDCTNGVIKGIKSRNVDRHVVVEGGANIEVSDVDMANSPEWEERRRQFKEGVIETFIVGVLITIVAGGILYAPGWT